MKYSVSVVIPNYNGKKLLEEYLPSVIEALKQADTEHEIIVSDDASTDDSVVFVKEKYPHIKIATSAINRGFSHTANNGIKLAGKKLVLLLNSDVKLKQDYFESQWKYFNDPATFGVMGSIWTEDGKHLMDSAKYPAWKGAQLRTTVNYRIKSKSSKPLLTLFLSGANALVDREKLMALQGFDTRYSPFYMEDVDLSVRAWRKGWKCYYEENAFCYHKLSESISSHSSEKKVRLISKRNKMLFHHIHLSGMRRVLWNIENTLNLLFRWLVADLSYYTYYSEYRKIVRENNLKDGYTQSLEDVVNEIKGSCATLEKELF